jgi:hypothetical protein
MKFVERMAVLTEEQRLHFEMLHRATAKVWVLRRHARRDQGGTAPGGTLRTA